jgi:hypothetical protein
MGSTSDICCAFKARMTVAADEMLLLYYVTSICQVTLAGGVVYTHHSRIEIHPTVWIC